MDNQAIYTIHDISSEAGVNQRTIKFWMHKKVVPPAMGNSPDGISYSEAHLRRVRKVKEWMESQITLSELAERIEVLGEKALEVPDPYADFDGWE